MIRAVIVYCAASVMTLMAGYWATGFFWLACILLGPIGLLGFAKPGVAPLHWSIELLVYFAAATLILAVLLRFRRRAGAIPRYLALVGMILTWLACSAFSFWLVSWSA